LAQFIKIANTVLGQIIASLSKMAISIIANMFHNAPQVFMERNNMQVKDLQFHLLAKVNLL
jgi:hypothetical protein